MSLERRADLLRWAEPRICAFDIETTKLPLQFPNAEYDQVCQCPARLALGLCPCAGARSVMIALATNHPAELC